jgi:type I restriction enzyme S subunit
MIAPKLRFKSSLGKEFPSWTKKKLIELSEGGFSNGVFNDPKKVGTGYRLINVLDMYIPSTIDESKLSRVAIGEAEFENNKVEHGDIFFTRSSLVKEGIAFSNVYLGNSDDITFDGHLIRLRPKKDLINAVCLNYLLRTKSVRYQLVTRGKTATMTTIGQADIATVDVEVPSIDEQQKIASFLSLVDSRIETIAKQYELLVEYKKGVMQKIFNQEIRFKDGAGKDFPDWEYVPLEEVLDYEQPGRYLVSSTKYSDDFNTPVLTAGKTFLLG